MGIIIAIANQKGGTAKTTTTINLGAALVERGYRALIVDCDPQSHATTTLLGSAFGGPGLLDLLWGQANGQPVAAETLVQPSNCAHLEILPSSKGAMQNVDAQFSAVMYREWLLSKGMGDLPGRYDFVLLDCPPNLGLLTQNALNLAHYVLVPMEPEPYAMDGLAMLLNVLDRVQVGGNPDLALLGVLVVNYQRAGRPVIHRDIRATVEEELSGQVFSQVIPQTVAVPESQAHCQPVLAYAPDSPASAAYRSVAGEVLQRVGLPARKD